MGLKKYEIITVGSDKRVRALRSWQVGDRYVNIGDVGGIVYDEKTLSQDGACWLFRGNFGFPGARIGGDSIVDVGEATLSTTGAPNVDILGSSVVVGSKLRFASRQTEADAVVLTADDFEQGGYAGLAVGQKPGKDDSSANFIRIKNPIFMGGKSIVIKAPVPGYIVTVLVTDADGYIIKPYKTIITDDYQNIPTEEGQYAYIRLTKNPAGPTVPTDATAAALTFTGTYETKLSIVDSRLEVNPANATGTATIRLGGVHTIASGVKYPESIIRNSKVVINGHATDNRIVRIMSEFIGCNVTIDATLDNSQSVGIYNNVNNLTFTGAVSSDSLNVNVPSGIQATDCDNFAVSPTIFPGLPDARTANMPFIFQGCNVPDGRFYHHAQIANTYKNIDFAKAQADLGKAIASGQILASAEVEGMYRLYSTTGSLFGGLVEGYDSVKSLNMAGTASSYGTTIYKDAYLNGLFDIAGTNVFGNKVRSHPLVQVLNVQPRAVQGQVNATNTGQTITGVVPNVGRVTVPKPFRINSSQGLSLAGIPAGIDAVIFFTTFQSVITGLATSIGNTYAVPASKLPEYMAYVTFRKTDGSSLTVDEIAGVTVTVYNGCKIVNTGAAAVNMGGNIRVEDNATLLRSSITGTGYFGGNAVASGLIVNGCAYMRDNASFTKTAGSTTIRDLKMTENAYAVMGDFSLNGRIHLSDNARFTPTAAGLSEGDLVMKDNAVVSGAVTIGGALTMKDNAKVSAGVLSTYGDITLCGSYNQTVSKSWTGKRVIDSVNEPEYDNNVKTQYDF